MIPLNLELLFAGVHVITKNLGSKETGYDQWDV